MKRRQFIYSLSGFALAAAGDPLAGENRTGSNTGRSPGEMGYRLLGKTGLRISEVSLGGSPVPDEPVFRLAMERGVNYVDTSSSYMNGNSERLIGRYIRDRRDRFIVATKFHPGRRHRDAPGLIGEVEGSLKRLKTDYIDILMVHGARDADILEADYVLEAFEGLKKQGKIRFTGVSCHRDPVGVLLPAINSGLYDMITLAYNAYSGTRVEQGRVYPDYLEESGIDTVLAAAARKRVGVVAMKVMAGGERQDLARFFSGGKSLAQAKIKWVLRDRRVSGIISEMLSFAHLEENLAAAGQPLSFHERFRLKNNVRRYSAEYCRMCGACEAVCSRSIPIADILRYRLYYSGYRKSGSARSAYGRLPRDINAAACLDCGACESRCPYGVAIRANLREAHRLLA